METVDVLKELKMQVIQGMSSLCKQLGNGYSNNQYENILQKISLIENYETLDNGKTYLQLFLN